MNYIKNNNLLYVPYKDELFIVYVPDGDHFIVANINTVKILEYANTPLSIEEIVAYAVSILDKETESSILSYVQTMVRECVLIPSNVPNSWPSLTARH